jgi:hypothetical protein
MEDPTTREAGEGEIVTDSAGHLGNVGGMTRNSSEGDPELLDMDVEEGGGGRANGAIMGQGREERGMSAAVVVIGVGDLLTDAHVHQLLCLGGKEYANENDNVLHTGGEDHSEPTHDLPLLVAPDVANCVVQRLEQPVAA